MKYLSICSGIEAASAKERYCAKCGNTKQLDDFHRQPTGKDGRHSWCKDCCNAYYRINRKRNYSPEQKRRWQLSTRYGINSQMVDDMRNKQDGRCAICNKSAKSLVVDHCHDTGKVRGLLCHACNILLPGIERKEWASKANEYLKTHEIR